MRHLGYLEKVWREGDILFGKVRVTSKTLISDFIVKGHVSIRGFTYPDKGQYALSDIVLGPSTEDSKFGPEFKHQNDLNRIKLFKLMPMGLMRDEDLDGLETQVKLANEEGVNFSVRVIEEGESCCQDMKEEQSGTD